MYNCSAVSDIHLYATIVSDWYAENEAEQD
jgi:hypothetical protein